MAVSPLVAWIGSPSPGKPGETRYQAARLQGKDGFAFSVGVGDYVHVESGAAVPYVARVKDLKEKGGKGLAVFQWLYLASEVPKLKASDTFSNEVFMNKHADENPIETILEPIRVAFKDPRSQQFTKSLLFADTSLQQVLADPPKYICMRSYDHVAETVSPIAFELFQESCVFPNKQHPTIQQVPVAPFVPRPLSPVAQRATVSSEAAANDPLGMRDMPSHPQNLSNLVTHAMTCAGCEQSLCRKMKMLLHHLKGCSGGPACKTCSQYMEIVTEHAKRCRLPVRTCNVPHCHDKKPSTIVEHALECLSSNVPCQVEDCESAKKFLKYVWSCPDDNCIVCLKFQSLLQLHETGCENGCMFPNCPHFSDTLKHALQRCPRGPSTCLRCAVLIILRNMHGKRCRQCAQCRFPVHVIAGQNGEHVIHVSGAGALPQPQHVNMQVGHQMGADNRLISRVGASELSANRVGLSVPPEDGTPRAFVPAVQSNGHIQTPLSSTVLPQQQVAQPSSVLTLDLPGAATRSVPSSQPVSSVQASSTQAVVVPVAMTTIATLVSSSLAEVPSAVATTSATIPAKKPSGMASSTSALPAPASAIPVEKPIAAMTSSSSAFPPAAPKTTTVKPAESSSLSTSSSSSSTTVAATTTSRSSPPIASNKRMKLVTEEEEDDEKVKATQKLNFLVRPMSLLDTNSDQTESRVSVKRSIFGILRPLSIDGKSLRDCVRIGPEFQAAIPAYSSTRPSVPTSTDTCFWSPEAKISREELFKERRRRKTELLSQRGAILNVVVSGGPKGGMWVRIVEPMKEGSTTLRVVPMQIIWPSSTCPADFTVPVSAVMFEVDAGSPDVRFPETLDEAVMYHLFIQKNYQEGSEQLAKLKEEFGTCWARGVPEIVSEWTRQSYMRLIQEKFVSKDAKHLSEKTGKTVLELNEFDSCFPDKPVIVYRSGLSCSACRKTPNDRLVACARFNICKTCFCVECTNQENAWRRRKSATEKSDDALTLSEKDVTEESILSEDAKGFVCFMCDLVLRSHLTPTKASSMIENCGLDFNPEYHWTVGRSEKRMNMIKIAQEHKKIPLTGANPPPPTNKTTTTTTTNTNTPSETSSIVSPSASPPATPVHSTSLPPTTPSSVRASQAPHAAAEQQQSPIRVQEHQSATPVKQQPPSQPQPPQAQAQQQQTPLKPQQQPTLQAKIPEVAAPPIPAKPTVQMFLDNESIIAAYDEKRLSALEAVNLIRNLLIEKSTKTLRSLATASSTTVQPL